MDNLGKIGRSLMDNWGEIRQLINILFCGYRQLEIREQSRNLYSSGAQMPQRVINSSDNTLLYKCIFV
jgi:hypothetical protein